MDTTPPTLKALNVRQRKVWNGKSKICKELMVIYSPEAKDEFT